MPKARKRKAPVTSENDRSSTSSKAKASRTVIRRFHVLLKNQKHLQNETRDAESARALADIEKEIEELGGLSAYQRMSSIGQGSDRGGGSEKILVGWLKELGWNDLGRRERHRLLEVGALKPDNYQSYATWLNVTPIDLRSRHPSILEQDFLLMDPQSNGSKWDIISLSLVVNFVPDALDRGRMLRLAHQTLRADGLLFLVLPLPCVLNSRYTTFEYLKDLMESIGFNQLEEKWRPGGKMVYWLYKKGSPSSDSGNPDRFSRKTVLRQGDRNNFTILLN
ncbi:hypothetical protein HETIRDRAFT_414665 [Heterobasidion irregulare TC 32-1]|uniref:25S rRNA adenine-N(1) methyltransferase n=1 Tax=Heterobasidion irregulare (strain TC 32-1) TaxID=747525 RepID=W4KK21_HETIT|nr:uncharacterized protein HETIRDRAFT_414665 [Heterobasidion irregulare TC 32-1]ETW85675.1 hypothetical protein HETIRDRAFT_414665 [Heterobasidion irregulare TC 32-1]